MATKTLPIDRLLDPIFLMLYRFHLPIMMTQPSSVNATDLLPLRVIGCLKRAIELNKNKWRSSYDALHDVFERVSNYEFVKVEDSER